MKRNSRISTVTVLGALCMCAANAAYGAASVRSLGGAGTYAGTASAGGTSSASTASTSAGSAVSRAGSVRVTPSANKTGASTSISGGASSSARSAASRLSVGKYLGSAITSGGKPLRPNISISNGGTGGGSGDNTIIAGDVQKIIDAIQRDVDALKAKEHHPAPVAGDDLVSVSEDSEISINIDNLAAELSGIMGVDSGSVDITITGEGDNEYISWCYIAPNGQCDYQELIAVSELRGAPGEKGDKGDSVSIEELTELVNTKVAAAIDALEFGALAKLNTVSGDQIDAGAVGTVQMADKSVTREKISDELWTEIQTGGSVDLSNYVTTDKLNEVVTPLQTGIDANTGAIVANTTAITSNTDAIGANTTNIATNTTNIAANAAAITQKANAADVYAKSETYSQIEIDEKLQGITAGGVSPAPDNNDWAWVSLGGEQKWVSIVGPDEANTDN